jgi:hypothetical protein
MGRDTGRGRRTSLGLARAGCERQARRGEGDDRCDHHEKFNEQTAGHPERAVSRSRT